MVSGVFGTPWAWSAPVRIGLFWAVVVAVAAVVWGRLAPLPFGEAVAIVAEALSGRIARMSTESFAFSLAAGIGALATGLLVAHGLFHWILVRMAIAAARATVEGAATKQEFAARHRAISAELSAHPLIGYPWREFDDTLIKAEVPFRNTLRPQVFFTPQALRERLGGLKLMGGEPGYFVGLGLLLTFIGLVIALSKAAAGTAAAQAAMGGAGAAAMQGALGELLQAATFKFATSVAGLAASIVLSLCYRVMAVGLESSLHRFCEAVDGRLDYVPPQAVTMEMRNGIYAQLEQLDLLASDAHLARMGQGMRAAVEPLAQSVDRAVAQVATSGQAGIEAMLDRFLAGVQGGAGSEMREIGASLTAMHGLLDKVRLDMTGSGADFAQAMSDAASGVSGQMQEAMGRTLGRLDEQIALLTQALAASARAHEGQAQAVDLASRRSGETAAAFGRSAEAIRTAVEPMGRANERFVGASEAMERATTALVDGQKGATALAGTLADQAEKLGALWASWEARFGEIDADLGRAFEKLAAETRKQSQILADQTGRIDAGLAKAVDTLSGHVRAIGDGAEDLAEAVEELGRALGAHAGRSAG